MVSCVNGCGPMSRTPYKGVSIDFCKLCKGVWLSLSNLAAIAERRAQTWSEKAIRKALAETGTPGIPSREHNKKIDCPVCGKNLPPTNYQYSSGVIINSCHDGHGAWLDVGELATIQIYMQESDKQFEKKEALYRVELDCIDKRNKTKENARKKGISSMLGSFLDSFDTFY